MAEVLQELRGEGAVLGYALERARWEGGTQWLLWVVCAGVISPLPYTCWWIWENARFMLGYFPRTTLKDWNYVIFSAVFVALRLGLGTATCLMALQGRKWKKVWSVSAILMLAGFLVEASLPMMIAMRHLRKLENWIPPICNVAYEAYPLLLNMCVLKVKNSEGRGKLIWRVTAWSLALATLPEVLKWMTSFRTEWEQMGLRPWNETILPWGVVIVEMIGIAMGAFASLAVYGVLGWRLCGGRAGRKPLLLLMAAMALGAGIISTVGLVGGIVENGWWIRDEVMLAFIKFLNLAGIGLMFPMAVRGALQLQAVNSWMDGVRVEEGGGG